MLKADGAVERCVIVGPEVNNAAIVISAGSTTNFFSYR